MSFKLLTSILLTGLVITSFGQSNFTKGFIVTNRNDTLYGQIDYRTEGINNKICRYRTQENAMVKEYLPGEIIGFRFTDKGKYYVSKTVVLDGIPQTLFLEFLLQGTINLYSSEVGRERYYFQKQDSAMIIMTQDPPKIVNNYLITDKAYMGIATFLFQDCPQALDLVSNLQFERLSLINITQAYHKCICTPNSPCIIFENKNLNKYAKLNFSVYSGYEWNVTSMVFNTDYKHKSSSPILGTELALSSPRLFKPVSILVGGYLSKFDDKYKTYNSALDRNYEYALSYNKIAMNIGLKYLWNTKTISPELSINYLGWYFSKIHTSYFYDYPDLFHPETRYTYSEKDVFWPQNSNKGIAIGTGVNIHTIKGQYCYIKATYNTMIKSKMYDTKTETFYKENIENSVLLKIGYGL